MKRLILLAALACGAASVAVAQQPIDATFGKGVHVIAQDSSFSLKFNYRVQSLMETDLPVVVSPVDGASSIGEVSTNWLIRRSRLKFSGFAYNPRLKYKIELGLSNRDHGGEVPQANNTSNLILDAFIRYKLVGNLEVWLGQTKLPGNRERVISSQNLQFVDRSLVNSRFNLDRDMGVQLRNSWTIGSVVTRQALSISQGEGRNRTADNPGGLEYTGRLEVLPMGVFTSKGDYFGSDLKREPMPKLSLGLTYDYNDRAGRERGAGGSYVPDTALNSLSTVLADFMFKYRGLSIAGEFASKQAVGNRLMVDNAFVSNYYTGTGINLQAGYLFESNYECALRYTAIQPEIASRRDLQEMYTLGFSKYISGHSLKVQSDFSYLLQTDESNSATSPASSATYLFRFQVEVAF
jgi:phosphate-selective porin OprO/OprP